MITYKNISFSAKTFYGVRFEPGDVREVPGYINCRGMVRLSNMPTVSTTIDTPKTSELIETPEVSVIKHTRGRKKKSIEPEEDSIVETTEIKISEEETTDGNPS